jgi:hypothetical protein
MKNKRPILLNCFSRGGSNILWNVLLSHPEVCSPIEETLQIFRLDWRAPRREGVQAAWLSGQMRFFDQWNFQARRPISEKARTFIDETLFQWKLRTLSDEEMRYKSSEELYTRAEVEASRLVLKNNNGVIFLSERFVDIYPDAVFFALVRDPIPLYESHKRNKTPVSRSPEAFAAFYATMIRKMQSDSARWNFHHILRFEDILRAPIESTQKIYDLAGLDISRAPKMRFKAKPHMQADGSHATSFKEGRHYWFSYDEIPQMLEPEVNKYQVSKLDARELETIRSLTRDIRAELGYPAS